MSEDKFNPWVSMWREPRQTIQTIAEHHPKRSLWLLAWVYGFTSLLNGFQSVPIALQVGLLPMFLLAVIIAPFWGYAAMSIWSYIIVLVGKVFKGKANFQTARAAYAAWQYPDLAHFSFYLSHELSRHARQYSGPNSADDPSLPYPCCQADSLCLVACDLSDCSSSSTGFFCDVCNWQLDLGRDCDRRCSMGYLDVRFHDGVTWHGLHQLVNTIRRGDVTNH